MRARVALLLAWLAAPGPVDADSPPPTGGRVSPCRPGDTPVLVLGFAGEGWDPVLADAVADLFRIAVEDRGFRVCAATTLGAVRPAARVTLRRDPGPDATVTVWIDVADAVTEKRLSRQLDAEAFPPDARPVALAAAADELLRASWLELATARDTGAPPAVRRAVDGDLAAARPARVRVGLVAVAEAWGGGERLLGGDLALALSLGDRGGLDVALGARGAPRHGAANGDVRAVAVSAGLDGSLDLLRGRSWALAAVVGAQLLGLRYEGIPGPGARGDTETGIAVAARGGLRLAWRPSARVQLRLEGGAGGALRGVSARDAGVDVVGVTGGTGYARLGVWVAP